jgi:glucose-1-phosphate cytidylyltransferase
MTITAIDLVQQKGLLDIDKDGSVSSFREKEEKDSSLVNGGFMICNSSVFDFISDDETVLEQEPMRQMASLGELRSYYHKGFWQCMDTQREFELLQELWISGKSPWKIWSD